MVTLPKIQRAVSSQKAKANIFQPKTNFIYKKAGNTMKYLIVTKIEINL